MLLYGGNLLFVFVGFVLFAWATRLMYRTFKLAAPPLWDVFFFLIASVMLAAFVGFFFPFLGLMISALPPGGRDQLMGRLCRAGDGGKTQGAMDEPLTSLRPG